MVAFYNHLQQAAATAAARAATGADATNGTAPADSPVAACTGPSAVQLGDVDEPTTTRSGSASASEGSSSLGGRGGTGDGGSDDSGGGDTRTCRGGDGESSTLAGALVTHDSFDDVMADCLRVYEEGVVRRSKPPPPPASE